MYHITLMENGVFCTNIGGEIETLPVAIAQLKRMSATLNATELDKVYGYKFDRAGTICGLIITDRFGFPVRNTDQED